jgi:hypothetical protein
MVTLTTVLLGFGSSIATEIITWLNKKLSGTALRGDGAYLLAVIVSFAAAIFETFVAHTATFGAFLSQFSLVWASSQVFFLIVIQYLGLDIETEINSTPVK